MANESSAHEHAHQTHRTNRDRSLGEVVAEIQQEIKEFISTRAQMIKSELQESLQATRIALLLAAIAILFLFVGFVMFTLSLAALVEVSFAGHPYGWFYAFVVVALAWVCLGAVIAFFALNEFKGRSRFPKRSVQVLKADKAWLQTQVRGIP
jgi:uncharacterized membrane protein YqjE